MKPIRHSARRRGGAANGRAHRRTKRKRYLVKSLDRREGEPFMSRQLYSISRLISKINGVLELLEMEVSDQKERHENWLKTGNYILPGHVGGKCLIS
jgi:hypothetical protein